MFSDDFAESALSTNLIRSFVDLERGITTKKEFLSKLDKNIANLSKLDDIDGFDDHFAKSICQQYRGIIDMAVGTCFKRSYIVGQKRKIDEFVKLLLRKKRALPSYSGIAIAGFGESEALPKLREYTVDAILSGKVRCWQLNSYEVTGSNASEIVPLADAGVIKTLIEGISPDFEDNIYNGAIKLIMGMPKQIIDPIVELDAAQKQKYIADATSALPQNFRDFFGNMVKYRRDNYTTPLKQAISNLPISDLAMIAETFLGVSHMQKRVRPELETVGGPVDVAVISKGDGFIWIKRKHYFDDKLNPSFKMKYMEP
jgi:hypothetical protein